MGGEIRGRGADASPIKSLKVLGVLEIRASRAAARNMSIAPLRPRLSRLCRRFVTLPAEPRVCGPPRRPYATHRFDERGEHIATYGEPTSAYDRFLLARWLSRDDRRLKHRHDGRLATPAQQKRAAGRTDTRAYNFAAPVAAESAVEPYQWSFFGDLFGGSGSVGAPRSSSGADV